MAGAIGLRKDFDVAALHQRARCSKDGSQARRLLTLVEIYEGGLAPLPLRRRGG